MRISAASGSPSSPSSSLPIPSSVTGNLDAVLNRLGISRNRLRRKYEQWKRVISELQSRLSTLLCYQQTQSTNRNSSSILPLTTSSSPSSFTASNNYKSKLIFFIVFILVLIFIYNIYLTLVPLNNWISIIMFQVTYSMKLSIFLSVILGLALGVTVGLISGLEPSVVIGVSASMALGCAFVMSFAIFHGVHPLRAVAFSIFVSLCLPFGFGFGFGSGVIMAIFLGLEDPYDIQEKTHDFIYNFSDFVKVVAAFTLEIL